MSRFSKLSRDNLVVNCRTPDEAKRFVQMAHDAGNRWENYPSSYVFWDRHMESTCYRIRTNTEGGKIPNVILYNNQGFYRRKGVTIISFQEFMEICRMTAEQPVPRRSTVASLEEAPQVKYSSKPPTFQESFGSQKMEVKRKPSIRFIEKGEAFRI